MKGFTAKYTITELGVHYYDFLGDPAHWSEEEKSENMKKRNAMTPEDWACEQVLVNLENACERGFSRDKLYEIFWRQSDYAGGVDSEKWKRTAEEARWTAENIDRILQLLLDRKLIKA